MVNGEWRFSEWSMVNGENSNILLFLNQNANSNSTLSVFSFQLSVIHYPCALLNSHPSPPQPARAPPQPRQRLDAYGNKGVNGGLVNGEW